MDSRVGRKSAASSAWRQSGVVAAETEAPAGEERQTKAEMAAEVLRHEIALGIRPPGSELPPEAQLLQSFGISRPSHREALRLLESEGLIRVSRGARGGAKVLMPNIEPISRYAGLYCQMRGVTLDELFEARRTYEPHAARAIALARDSAVLGALAQCVAGQEYSVHDRVAFNTHEAVFRQLLLEHCGNTVLQMMGAMLESVFNRHMRNVALRLPALEHEADDLKAGVAAKQTLIKLMAKGDGDGAARAWDVYIRTYWQRVRENVGGGNPIEVYSVDFPPPDPAAPDKPAGQDRCQPKRSAHRRR